MRRVLKEFYHPLVSLVLLGILSALYFGVLRTVWAVTGEFTRWGGHLLQFFGYPVQDLSYLKIVKIDKLPWERGDGWVVFGMFAGALIAALSGNNFKIRVPAQRRRLMQGIIGGMFSGFGARMAMGCNLAAMFTGVPQFTLHAVFFTIGTIAGTWFGLRIALHPLVLGTPKIVASGGKTIKSTANKERGTQPWLALILGLAFFWLIGQYFFNGLAQLAWAGLFGWIFGWLIQKGQVCFTSAFRDLWISGRATMTKALVWGMAVQSVGTAVFIAQGIPAKVMWAGPNALIGGLLFGIGIVIAGGCETGWMYRAMEGQVHFWMVGIGNIIGAAALTLLWDQGIYQKLAAPWPKVDLVRTLGWPGAFVVVYGFLSLLYIFARMIEKRKTFTSMVELPINETIFTKGRRTDSGRNQN